MRAAALAAMTLLAGVSAPLLAQAASDPARLDEFAISLPENDRSHVDQLAAGEDSPQGSPQPRDRATAASQPSVPRTAALRQISPEDRTPQQPQLSKAGAPPDETQAAVSSTADSRPQGVARLGGHDRCDPQLAREELERCRRILELRAQEFNAPAPPQLSAEQQLLAEQRSEDEQAGRSPATRLRLASRDTPDADLQSNQELAALYLDRQQAPAADGAPPEDQQAATGDASLAQILQGLQVQTGGTPPRP
jgi:hypothetical protein